MKYIEMGKVTSVTRLGKFCRFAESLRHFFRVHLVLGKILNTLWLLCHVVWLSFIAVNGQIWKIIWLSGHTGRQVHWQRESWPETDTGKDRNNLLPWISVTRCWNKNSPDASKSCPKSRQNSFYLTVKHFKLAQKISKYFGYFCMRI